MSDEKSNTPIAKTDDPPEETEGEILSGFPDEVRRAIESLPEKERIALLGVIEVTREESSEYRGPIPPPDFLAKYGEIDSAFPERLISAWERESDHRRQLQNRASNGSEKRMNRSQWLGASIAGVGIVAAVVAGVLGATGVGIAIAIVSVGGPPAASILARVFLRLRDD